MTKISSNFNWHDSQSTLSWVWEQTAKIDVTNKLSRSPKNTVSTHRKKFIWPHLVNFLNQVILIENDFEWQMSNGSRDNGEPSWRPEWDLWLCVSLQCVLTNWAEFVPFFGSKSIKMHTQYLHAWRFCCSRHCLIQSNSSYLEAYSRTRLLFSCLRI